MSRSDIKGIDSSPQQPGVSFHFRAIDYRVGDARLLDNIRGSVEPGQILAIMGASGAG